MRLPLEQITGVKRIGPQLEDTAELTWWGSGPEAEFLHQRRLLGRDEGLELMIKLGELGMVRDRVQRSMVALVSLVLPDVYWPRRVSVPAVISFRGAVEATHQRYRSRQPRSASSPSSGPSLMAPLVHLHLRITVTISWVVDNAY